MNKCLTKVALRYRAVYLDVSRTDLDRTSEVTAPVLAFVARLRDTGYCVSEELLHALNGVGEERLAEITDCIDEVMGVHLNWAALVKGWDVPTGETRTDHLVTLFVNLMDRNGVAGLVGVRLRCGHLIPDGTFPLERYNGCPFCGTPFVTADYVHKGQGSKLKELRLFTTDDIREVFHSLLTSPTPLDATQKDSLEQLLQEFALPDGMTVAVKETAMLAVKTLVAQGRDDEAARLLKSPTDILRYLWYEKTGYLQLLEPKVLTSHAQKLYAHIWGPLDCSADAKEQMRLRLRLKYNRATCQRVARWLNAVPMEARSAAENMHSKRGMWVRMIRALRLSEYAHRQGYKHLRELLDVFYWQDYTPWQGRVDAARQDGNATEMLQLLKQRPGLFARSLFATMLRFGSERVLNAFSEVADQLPARLLLSLDNAAESYFDPAQNRLARPLTGVVHRIGPNKLLTQYDATALLDMQHRINTMFRESMERRYAAVPTASETIYIEPSLYQIPVAVGDRTATVQDASCALMGTRFPVEGDRVRLFLQWGKGLHAQPLDMDLSCRIALPGGQVAECAYYNLTCVGAKHSGDIRSIPEMVGTAEYIELVISELEEAGAHYVTFTCNAYSAGALSPNLMVGWMNSQYPMKISETDGVAYDPSCVQHIVRIGEGNLSKGLVFGVLDVAKREIVWLEMPFTAQTMKGMDSASVEALLHRLENKLTIGELLELKARAQHLRRVENAQDADEAYTYEWALNPAALTSSLL